MKFTYRHTRNAAYIGYISQAIVNNLAPLLFVSFQREFGLSLDKISLLITINFGVQIAVDLLAAKYIDRIGYRAAALLAHVAVALGLVGLAVLPFVMPPFAGLAAAAVVYAVGGGLTEVIISPIVEALPGEEKEAAMSLLHSFYCWGQVAVVLLSTLYFKTAGIEHWNYLPLVWAVVPAFNIFLFAKVPLRTLNEDGESMPVSRLFRVKMFWIFLLLMICAGASELAMSQWASLFAEEGLQVSKTMGDLLGPCAFAVLMGIARTFYGIRGARLNLTRTILFSSVLCITSYLLAVFAPHPVLALAGCALTGLSVGIMWPGTFSIASKYYPQGGTAMFAILALAGDIGCSSGPTLAGFVADHTGDMHDGLLAAAAFPLLLIAGIVLLERQAARQNRQAVKQG
ncbi:MAG: MFS transporter [Lachnospiraceae bacterium]|nr:MFS transporter [Lachnospiraceae bacterium]